MAVPEPKTTRFITKSRIQEVRIQKEVIRAVIGDKKQESEFRIQETEEKKICGCGSPPYYSGS
jgi:hypothetical protein